MNFLTPFYAAAALAIAAPILLHLVKRQPKDRVEFSSLLFLPESPPKLTRSSRIENWFLLFLRSLVLLMIAMAFARPYWSDASESDRNATIGKRTCIVIDQSASMQRDGVWDDAIRKANEVIDNANAADIIAVYAFDHAVHSPFPFSSAKGIPIGKRASSAKSAMEPLRPGWSQGNLGLALVACLDALQADATDSENTVQGDSEIVVISDLSEGCDLLALSGSQWPDDTTVRILRAVPSQPGNAYFSILDPANSPSESGESSQQRDTQSRDLRLRVSNTPNSRNESLQLQWLDRDAKPIASTVTPITLAAGSHRVIPFPAPPENGAGIELIGDESNFDNRRYWIVEPPEPRTIYVIENDHLEPENSLTYFLRLLPFDKHPYQVQVQRVDPGSDWYTPSEKPPVWVILSHHATERDAEQCRSLLDAGGSVSLVMDSPADTPWENGMTVGENMRKLTSICAEVDIGSVSEGKLREFAILQRFDFAHPVLAPLADPQFNDFSRTRIWKHRRLDAPNSESWRVLAWFDADAPALMERAVGRGKLLVMAFGWQPVESQLALSSKFVPMMAGIFAQSTTAPKSDQSGIAGDGPFSVPGIYPDPADDADGRRIAVNVHPKESLTEPMDPSELSRYGVRLASGTSSKTVSDPQRRKLVAAELESRQAWWWWLVSACLVAVGLESMLCWVRPGSTQPSTA